jgi:hypothetical protein
LIFELTFVGGAVMTTLNTIKPFFLEIIYFLKPCCSLRAGKNSHSMLGAVAETYALKWGFPGPSGPPIQGKISPQKINKRY